MSSIESYVNDKTKAKSILIVQTAFIGDVILGAPLYKQIKKIWPQHRLQIVVRRGLKELLLSLGVFDEVFEVEKANAESYQTILISLKNSDIDYLLCLHQSFRSALFTSKIKAQTKIGFKNWWNSFFFEQRIVKDMTLPEPLRQLQIIQQFLPTEIQAELKTSDKYSYGARIPEFLTSKFFDSKPHSPKQKTIAIFPGSVWPTKQWTEEGFVNLTQKLLQAGNNVLLMGGPPEAELCARILEKIDKKYSKDITSTAGKKSLVESVRDLNQVDLVISNDSGGQHMASLYDLPCVSIFGPTVLSQGYRPWVSRTRIVENKNLSCRPCGKHGHKKCPLGTHECMKSISAEMVIKQVNEVSQLTS